MSHAYFIHFQGLAQAGPALIAALEAALRSEHAEGSILHAPVVLPGTDPLPVDPDDRLALCQLSQSSLLDPHTSNAIATRLDAIGRAIPGVQTIAHQTMAVERYRTAPEPSTSIVSFFVQYNGPARDPAAFHAYYRAHHVPIVQRMPGIRTIDYYTPTAWSPPPGVTVVDYLQLVQVTFDDVAGLQTMRRSPERREGLRDFANYPAFEGPVTHQGMLGRRIRIRA